MTLSGLQCSEASSWGVIALLYTTWKLEFTVLTLMDDHIWVLPVLSTPSITMGMGWWWARYVLYTDHQIYGCYHIWYGAHPYCILAWQSESGLFESPMATTPPGMHWLFYQMEKLITEQALSLLLTLYSTLLLYHFNQLDTAVTLWHIGCVRQNGTVWQRHLWPMTLGKFLTKWLEPWQTPMLHCMSTRGWHGQNAMWPMTCNVFDKTEVAMTHDCPIDWNGTVYMYLPLTSFWLDYINHISFLLLCYMLEK